MRTYFHKALKLTGLPSGRALAPIHDNATENEIRPFFSGALRWLFANNPLGARASAHLFTLVSSALANGLEPYIYLNYIFENLPDADTMEALEALLPCNARAALLPSQHSAV